MDKANVKQILEKRAKESLKLLCRCNVNCFSHGNEGFATNPFQMKLFIIDVILMHVQIHIEALSCFCVICAHEDHHQILQLNDSMEL